MDFILIKSKSLLNLEKYEELFEILNKYPDNLDFILIKSKTLFNLKKYEELFEFLNSYDESIYENIGIVKLKIDLLQHFQLIDEVVKFVNKSLIYYPNNVELININMDTIGEYVEIEDEPLLQEIIKVNPNNSEAYICLAYVYKDYGEKDCSKNDQAVKYYDKAIELKKSEPYYDGAIPKHFYLEKGQILVDAKKYQDALSTFDLIPDNDINAESVFTEKSTIYRELGEYDKALKFIDLAIEKDKYDDSYLKELKGSIYLSMKDYNTAIEYFSQGLEEGGKSTYYSMALALKGKEEYGEAIEFLKKIKPNDYLLENGKTDFEYEKAQKLIKEINDLI